jgi:hypothetical protein
LRGSDCWVVPLDSLNFILLDSLLSWQDTFVLRSLLIREHVPLVLLVFDFVHEDEPLGIFFFLSCFLLCLNLAWVQKVALLGLLFWVNQSDCSLLLQEPFISLFQVVDLLVLIIGIDDLSEHCFEAHEESLHIGEINTVFLLNLDLLGIRSIFAMALCFDIELNESTLKSYENWVSFKVRATKRLLFQLETLHLLCLSAHFVKVTITVIEIWIDLLLVLGSAVVTL